MYSKELHNIKSKLEEFSQELNTGFNIDRNEYYELKSVITKVKNITKQIVKLINNEQNESPSNKLDNIQGEIEEICDQDLDYGKNYLPDNVIDKISLLCDVTQIIGIIINNINKQKEFNDILEKIHNNEINELHISPDFMRKRTDKLINALKQNDSLRIIKIEMPTPYDNNDSKNLERIIDVLINNKNLKLENFDFSNNKIDSIIAKSIADLLKESNSLNSLNISRADTEAENITTIIGALSHNNTVTHLNISCNTINIESQKLLVRKIINRYCNIKAVEANNVTVESKEINYTYLINLRKNFIALYHFDELPNTIINWQLGLYSKYTQQKQQIKTDIQNSNINYLKDSLSFINILNFIEILEPENKEKILGDKEENHFNNVSKYIRQNYFGSDPKPKFRIQNSQNLKLKVMDQKRGHTP